LDHEPLVYPTFQGNNFWFFVAAPVAQSVFYILARKVSWLLNIYIAVSASCVAVFVYNLLTDDGYRFTYWHQGDYLCLHGCDYPWIFGFLVFLQGCILMFTPSTFYNVPGIWRAWLGVVLLALLCWTFLTSFFLPIA
jgi:hypothetical protein